MNTLIQGLNALSSLWWPYVWHTTWQAAVAAGILLVAVRLGRRWPAPLQYGLLVIALLKFVFPPLLSVPTGLFSRVGPTVSLSEPVGIASHSWSSIPRALQSPSEQNAISASQAPSAEGIVSRRPDRATTATKQSLPRGTNLQPRLAVEWKGLLLAGHLLGSAMVLWWIGRQWSRLRAATHQARLVTDGDIAVEFRQVVEQFGLRRSPRLIISDEIRSPIVFGVLRQTVMLPSTTINGRPASELRTILAHEMAHIYRRDPWLIWLQLILLAAWWFNPVLWLLNRAIRKAREDCCDDLLLSRGLTSPDTYCDVLVRAASELTGQPVVGAALGFGEQIHPLERRIVRIMDRTIKRRPALSMAGTLSVLFFGAVLLPGVRSQESKPPAAVTSAKVRVDGRIGAASESPPAGPSEPVEALFAKLRCVGEDNGCFEQMQNVSRRMGPRAVPFLLAKLAKEPGHEDDGKRVEERRKAAMSLGFIGAETERVVPQLITALEDDADLYYAVELDKDVRSIRVSTVAADALGQIGPKAAPAVPALLAAAKSGNARSLVALARIAPESEEVFRTLTAALNDNTKRRRLPLEGDYRRAALDALGIAARRNPAAVAPVTAALREADPFLRGRAAELLAGLSEGLPEVKRFVTETLKHGTLAEQVHLAVAVARAGGRSDESCSILVNAIRSEDTALSGAALDAIACFGPRAKEVLPMLTKMVQTGQGRLRGKALRAAVSVGKGDSKVISLVIESLTSPDREVRNEAFWILPSFGESAREAEPVLLKLLNDPDPQTRGGAALALGGIGAAPEKAVPALKAALADSDSFVQSAAIQSLAKFGDAARDLLPVMIEMLEGTNCQGAANALADLGPLAQPAVPALAKALGSPDDGLRNNAAVALGKIGPGAKAAIPALVVAMGDTDNSTRLNAALALWKIDRRTDLVPMLIEQIESDKKLDPLERRHARSSCAVDVLWLAKLGPDAKAAVPVLEKLSSASNDNLREVVTRALKQIRGNEVSEK
jgi:HEAT repeat protein/beta-lactamase regulating signal transducer with metallopeptidase domain